LEAAEETRIDGEDKVARFVIKLKDSGLGDAAADHKERKRKHTQLLEKSGFVVDESLTLRIEMNG
jgi:hypothetical protein